MPKNENFLESLKVLENGKMFRSLIKFDYNRHTVANRCACHSVNLYGIHIAVCCTVGITFFGYIQKLFNSLAQVHNDEKFLKKNI